MKYKFSEIFDIPKLQKLMERLYLASGIPSAIIDIDGNILVAVAWQNICTKFHRVNIETELSCRQSDQYLKEHLRERGSIVPYIYYTCPNGLIDAAAPIIINGEHLASIFNGQFLFEKPDIEKFRNQARKYGFDEEKYLKELVNVPIYSKDKLDSIMHYFLQLAEMLGEMGVDRFRLIESQNKVLEESEARLKTIINNTPNVAIQSYDEDGKILFVNKASETIFGWVSEEIVGKTLDQLNWSKENAANMNKFKDLLESCKTRKPYKAFESIYINKQRIKKNIFTTLFPINLFGGKREFISIDIDITEKKRFEKEMKRLDQLNIIGQMAAGIGHEIRNPMTTVRGYLQLLQNRVELQAFKSQFKLMIDEIDRANSIITEFLTLAKTKPTKTEVCNLNELISKLFPLIQADTFTQNKQIIFEPGEIPQIHLNTKEIRQLILNLCRNGLEAMKADGCLTLKTYKDGQNVVLSVRDEGIGIPIENLDMLGKPFFTTKDIGTGLGLANCYNIATRHKAKIDINTGLNGTTFFVTFNSNCESSAQCLSS